MFWRWSCPASTPVAGAKTLGIETGKNKSCKSAKKRNKMWLYTTVDNGADGRALQGAVQTARVTEGYLLGTVGVALLRGPALSR